MHERVAEQPLRFGVDTGDRLVEDQELGITDERFGDEDALLLSAGELVHAPAPQFRERDGAQRVVDGIAVRGAGPSPPTPSGEPPGAHHFLDGRRQVRWQLGPLRYVADAIAVLEAAGFLAEHRNAPRARSQQAEQDAQQRRLAAAVRADQRRELALVDPERDVGQDRRRAVREREVLDVDDGREIGSRDANHNESDSQVSASSRRRRR